MGPAKATITAFTRFADFRGRATRSEFGWWHLIANIALFTAILCDSLFVADEVGDFGHFTFFGFGPIAFATLAALLPPTLSVFVRRLKDCDRSGWWALATLLPYVYWVFALFLVIWRGTAGPNRFGPDPRMTAA